MRELKTISLFTGSGMLDKGVEAALAQFGYSCRPILYCEQNAFAQKVILARIKDGLIPEAPLWADVRTLPAGRFRGMVDAVVAGFPCQDLSVAGKQEGFHKHDQWLIRDEFEGRDYYIPASKRKAFQRVRENDGISIALSQFGVAPGKLKHRDGFGGNGTGAQTRSGLFFEVVRVAVECGAALIFLENVPGLCSTKCSLPDGGIWPAAGVVAETLAESGYLSRWLHLAAEDVGAPHGRERWWCIASLVNASSEAAVRGNELAKP